MKPKKPHKPKDWQKNIEERIEVEKVQLGHPQGKERFKKAVKRAGKKKAD